jgi:hypothetical protein
MTAFLGLKENAQPDLDGELIGFATKAMTPAPMRREALFGLVQGMSEGTQSALLTLLETGDRAGQLELLHAINDKRWQAYSGLQKILHSEARSEQFYGALRKLSKSDDAEIAVRALSLLADFNDAAAIGMLASAPQPKDRTTVRMFIEALSRRDNETCAPIVRGKGRERLDAYAKDAAADVRAIYASRLGYCAGGPERLPDVEGLLPLLNDPSPLVRAMSVESLGVTYSASAGTLFHENLGPVRKRLEGLKKTELDPRVIRQLDESLKEMLKE